MTVLAEDISTDSPATLLSTPALVRRCVGISAAEPPSLVNLQAGMG